MCSAWRGQFQGGRGAKWYGRKGRDKKVGSKGLRAGQKKIGAKDHHHKLASFLMGKGWIFPFRAIMDCRSQLTLEGGCNKIGKDDPRNGKR